MQVKILSNYSRAREEKCAIRGFIVQLLSVLLCSFPRRIGYNFKKISLEIVTW